MDIFLHRVPDKWIAASFDVMPEAEQHLHLVLTKRPERMREFVGIWEEDYMPTNIWLGVSAEDQE